MYIVFFLIIVHIAFFNKRYLYERSRSLFIAPLYTKTNSCKANNVNGKISSAKCAQIYQ